MGFFKKIGKAFGTAGKVGWKVWNSPEGQILIGAFAPAKAVQLAQDAVVIVDQIKSNMEADAKRERAKELVLAVLEPAERKLLEENPKLLNFMIEAALQKLDGNS